MLSIVLLSIVSLVRTQYYSPQQQRPLNNFNSWPTYSQNYPPWNQAIQQNQASVRGNLFSADASVLPYGSRITITLADTSLQDTAARPLNIFSLYGSYRFPIAYEISYSPAQVQANNMPQYSIQARIEKDGQLLYINDQYTPVQLLPAPIAPVNIFMKNIGTGSYPGTNGGIYTPRPPTINSMYLCQLRPDPGRCYASFEQYYFNSQLRSCQSFIWGGCGGNQNRFSTREECERTCSSYRRRMSNDNAKQVPAG